MFITKRLLVNNGKLVVSNGKAVSNGKGLYSSHDLIEILHFPHFCHYCSAKYSWKKRDERKLSPPICLFFFLPVFSFVFLPPSSGVLEQCSVLSLFIFPSYLFFSCGKS